MRLDRTHGIIAPPLDRTTGRPARLQDMEGPMSDVPNPPGEAEPTQPPAYPEITPNPGFEEAPDTSPVPQEEETGRPHDGPEPG
jgi:hypothetical protein